MDFQIDTPRFTGRVVNEEYTAAVYDFLCGNKDFFAPYEATPPEAYTSRDFIAAMIRAEYKQAVTGLGARYYFFSKQSSETIVASVHIIHPYAGPFLSCELGYKVGQSFLRDGVATECLSSLLAEMRDKDHLHRAMAYVRPDNLPSRFLLQKLGFFEVGTVRDYAQIDGVWQDHLLYEKIL